MLIPGVKNVKKAPIPVKIGVTDDTPMNDVHEQNLSYIYGWMGILLYLPSWIDVGIMEDIKKQHPTYSVTVPVGEGWEAYVFRFKSYDALNAWQFAVEFESSYAFGTGVLYNAYRGDPFTEDKADMRFYLHREDDEVKIGIDYPKFSIMDKQGD